MWHQDISRNYIHGLCGRQIQEKCQDKNKDLYMAFIYLTIRHSILLTVKFFGNSVHIWLPYNFYPANFITILRLLHDKMTTTVFITGIETETFTIRTEMKQGYVIAPTLFTIYLCAILFLVRNRLPRVVEMYYRLDGRLFNLSRDKAKTKVTKTAIVDLRYADDCAILEHTAEELQTSLDLLTEAYQSR